MTTLTKEMLLYEIQAYLDGNSPFSSVRRFVFQYFEAEDNFEVTEELDSIFEVLLPYLHYEESQGDPACELRLRRLAGLLKEYGGLPLTAVAVFAIEFDEIRELTQKFSNSTIPENVYHDQIVKLSPTKFDYQLVKAWAAKHVSEQEPVLAKMNG